MGRTNAELVVKANTSPVRALGDVLKRSMGMGRSESAKLQAEIKRVDRAMVDLAKTQRGLVLDMRKVSAGTDEYKKLAGQVEAADKAMQSLRKESQKMQTIQRQAESGGGGASRFFGKGGAGHLAGLRAQRLADALMGAAGGSPTSPYSAMGSLLSAGANALTAIPGFGAPLSIAAGFGAMGMQVRQQRMDRYLAFQGAMAGSAPHIAPSARSEWFGSSIGMAPEQAMATAAGFTRAAGGQISFGDTALEMAHRGFGPQVAAAGSLFRAGGMSNDVRHAWGDTNDSRAGFVSRLLDAATGLEMESGGGIVSPARIEERLGEIVSYTRKMADQGIEVDPFAVASMHSAWSAAGLSIAGQAGLSRQAFSGQRREALQAKMDASVGSEGVGNIIGLLAAGFGRGTSLAEAMFKTEAGVGMSPGQVDPSAYFGTIQRLFGRGGAQADILDVMVGKSLGYSSREAAGLRRLDPSVFSGALAPQGNFRDLPGWNARPEMVDTLDREAITGGRKYATEATGTMRDMFDLQTEAAEFAGTLVDLTKEVKAVAKEWANEIKDYLRGSGSGIPSVPGGR